MAANRTPRTPSYRLHKPTGQAFVEIEGKRHYLGKHELPETKQAYHRMVSEWIANGYRLPVAPEEVTIAEVCDAYLAHCKVYYRTQDGQPTSTLSECRQCANLVLGLYGDKKAVTFGPNALRAVRQKWIDDGLSISTINSYAGTIKQMFKWAASHEMIPVETYQALATLPGLRRGRGVGKDPQPREVVPQEDIDKTLEYLPRPLQAVVKLQLHTGARPSEILNLKRGDIDCTGEVWVAIIRDHKMSYRGKERRLFFGPRAKSVLRPFLVRHDGQYLFSPKEAVKERRENARKGPGRRENQKPDARRTERTIGDCYDFRAYGSAVRVACKKAGVDSWSPYRLRHTAATTIEASSDLETAKAILGHSGLDITQIYVHKDHKAAAAWAAAHG